MKHSNSGHPSAGMPPSQASGLTADAALGDSSTRSLLGAAITKVQAL